jgi:hypothetical protein
MQSVIRVPASQYDGAFFAGRPKDGVSPKSAGITLEPHSPIPWAHRRGGSTEIGRGSHVSNYLTLGGVQQLAQVPGGQRNLEDRSSLRTRARG